MSVFSETIRATVSQRAGQACEYCRLSVQAQVGRFPVDHVQPRSKGGSTEIENLALACPHCNAHKWAHVDGVDPQTGKLARLFNPRSDRWDDHFQWSGKTMFQLDGKTAVARATIVRLRMNDLSMLEIRRLLSDLEAPTAKSRMPANE